MMKESLFSSSSIYSSSRDYLLYLIGLLLPFEDAAFESFVFIFSTAYLFAAFSPDELGVKSLIRLGLPLVITFVPFLYKGDCVELFYLLSLELDLDLSLTVESPP